MHKIVALTYLKKNQGNQESENDNTVKRDLGNVNFSADHDNYEVLPSSLNKVADLESRRKADSSEWVLSQQAFCNLCLKLRTPTTDLTALGVSHQVAQYVAWKQDPYNIATDAMSIP